MQVFAAALEAGPAHEDEWMDAQREPKPLKKGRKKGKPKLCRL